MGCSSSAPVLLIAAARQRNVDPTHVIASLSESTGNSPPCALDSDASATSRACESVPTLDLKSELEQLVLGLGDNERGPISALRRRMVETAGSLEELEGNAAVAHDALAVACTRIEGDIASISSLEFADWRRLTLRARRDELEAEIERATVIKRTAMEVVLQAADSALDVASETVTQAQTAFKSLSEAELYAAAPAWRARLASVAAQADAVFLLESGHPALRFVPATMLPPRLLEDQQQLLRLGHIAAEGYMYPPLRLQGASCDSPQSPCVSSSGTMYIPHLTRGLVAHDCFGRPVAPPPTARCGLPRTLRATAFDHRSGILVVGGFGDSVTLTGGRLVALQPSTGRLAWTAMGPGCWECAGIAVLPDAGVCVVAAHVSGALVVRSLATGCLLASVPAERPTFIAADNKRGVIYASVRFGPAGEGAAEDLEDAHVVQAWAWRPDTPAESGAGPNGTLVSLGVIEAAGMGGRPRPLAFIPHHTSGADAAAANIWYGAAAAAEGTTAGGDEEEDTLVVGELDCGTLQAVSVPSHRALGERRLLEGVLLAGLAGDSSGRALVVCDVSMEIVYVLPWPLPPQSELASLLRPAFAASNRGDGGEAGDCFVSPPPSWLAEREPDSQWESENGIWVQPMLEDALCSRS